MKTAAPKRRLKQLPPRLQAAPSRLPSTPADRYGKGRGGRPWRRVRDQVMRRDGNLCQPCHRAGRLTLATEVDHITPLSQGGADLDQANLEAICATCHGAKTAREARRARG